MPSRKFSVCTTFHDTMPPGRMPQFTSERPNTASSAASARSQGKDLGEAAAEAVAVDHGDCRLREGRQLLPAPLVRGPARLAAQHRIGVSPPEKELDILPGPETLAP